MDYGVATFMVAVAALFRWWLNGVWTTSATFFTFYIAIILVALLTGGTGALAATVLSGVVATLVFIEPRWSLSAVHPEDLVALGFLGLAGVLTSWIAELLSQARQREWTWAERAKVSDELRQSEERYRLATEAVAGLLYDHDYHTNSVHWSIGLKDLIGYSPEESVPNLAWWQERIHPDDLGPLKSEIDRTTARRLPLYEIEYRILHRDGRWIHVCDKGRVIYALDGRVQRTVGCTVDITERTQAEQRLRESQATLKTFYDTSPFMMGVVELDGHDLRGVHANENAARFFGATPGQLFTRTGGVFSSTPEIYQLWMRHYRQSLAEQRHVQFEYEHPRPSGPLWLSVTVSYLGLGPTERPRFSFVAEDVTERKAADRALRERERLLQISQQAAHVGNWSLELASHRFTWSDEMYRIHGVDRDLFLSTVHNVNALVHPHDLSLLEKSAADLLAGKPVEPFEYRVHRADGSQRIVRVLEVQLETSPAGQPLRTHGVIIDVTEQRQKEELLRASEARLRLAKQAARLGIFDFDPVVGRLDWDERMRDLWGLRADEQATYPCFLAGVHPEDRTQTQAAVDRALDPAGDGRFFAEFRVTSSFDQRSRWVAATGQAIFRAGHPVRLVGTVQDITERRQFQEELERLVAERTEKLQDLVGELEHFSYSITHDMRAPLRAMRGFGELAYDLCADSAHPEQRDFLRKIMVSAERMDALIRDALNYTHSVRMELPLQEVDTGRLLRGMLETYPELQSVRDCIQVHGPLPLVLGNEAGLTQCFSNLLANAVKFVRPQERPEVRVRAEERDGWARIWVEDKGIGIPPVMLPRVFQMFSRGSKQYEGTGIGLALVRKVVQRMGGKVGVESELGKGSRFWVEVRRPERHARQVGEHFARPPASLPRPGVSAPEVAFTAPPPGC